MVEAIVRNGCIVEPWAVTTFPFRSAYHAEFCSTSTSHVVATLLQFYRRRAVVAALPSLLFDHIGKFEGLFVVGAFLRCMPLTITGSANLRFTFGTFPILAASIYATRCINVYIPGLNPSATTFGWAVYSILRGILLILSIPFHLELVIE